MVSYEVISPISPDIFAELGRLDARAVARATEHHPSGTRHRLAVGVKKKSGGARWKHPWGWRRFLEAKEGEVWE